VRCSAGRETPTRAVDGHSLLRRGIGTPAQVAGAAVPGPNGRAPTGRRFEAEQVHIWRAADGRLAEHRMFRDDLGTLRQLGALKA
jgi:ketosteroid isomerase-like protein